MLICGQKVKAPLCLCKEEKDNGGSKEGGKWMFILQASNLQSYPLQEAEATFVYPCENCVLLSDYVQCSIAWVA